MDQPPSAPLNSLFDRTLGRLPYDAWHECIRFAAMQSVGGPLPYLAVSSSWADSIIDSPHLWTTILFDGGEDEEARLHTFSYLSQDLPLYLVYLYSGDGKVMEHFINGHRLRIQSIEDNLEGHRARRAGLSAVLVTITTSLPALRYLINGYSLYMSREFLSNCVNLRVLQWPPIRFGNQACLGPHVESIGFNDVEPSMITKSTRRTNIRQLELDLHYGDNGRLWDEMPSDALGIHMANLFTKIGQNLRHLTLHISFHLYSSFILLVPSILGLHTLSLDLLVTQDLKNLAQLLPVRIRHSDIQAIRVLFVRLSPRSGNGSDPRPADALIQSLTAESPLRELEIFDFDCWGACHEGYLGPLLQSAVRAHRIRIYTTSNMILTFFRMKRQLMPRLRSLELGSLRLYNYIEAPNLDKLTLDDDQIGDIVPLEIDAVMDLQRLTLPASVMDDVGITGWPLWNCKSIEFIFDECPRDITPLSQLENVEFSGGDTAVNEFLLKMLENPDTCPRLHTIATSAYPWWEILFEVLRNRNSSTVQRITQIRLPRLPVLQLLWRLVRLLSGETAVFTNRDVDDIIAKRALCPQILCCFDCIQAGYISCIGDSQSPRYGEMDSSDFQNLLDLDYPADRGSFTIHDLRNKWRNYQDSQEGPIRYNRYRADHGETNQCDAYGRDSTVDITEHTLDGMSIPPWISTSGGWDANDGLKDL